MILCPDIKYIYLTDIRLNFLRNDFLASLFYKFFNCAIYFFKSFADFFGTVLIKRIMHCNSAINCY